MTVRVPGPTGPDRCRLYVLQCHDFFKVGVSNTIAERIIGLQLGNPYPLTLAMYRTFPQSQVRLVERDIHDLLRQWELGREWFSAPFRTIQDAVKLAMGEALRREREFEARQAEYASRPIRVTKPKSKISGLPVEYRQGGMPDTLYEIRKANKLKMLRRLERMQEC